MTWTIFTTIPERWKNPQTKGRSPQLWFNALIQCKWDRVQVYPIAVSSNYNGQICRNGTRVFLNRSSCMTGKTASTLRADAGFVASWARRPPAPFGRGCRWRVREGRIVSAAPGWLMKESSAFEHVVHLLQHSLMARWRRTDFLSSPFSPISHSFSIGLLCMPSMY